MYTKGKPIIIREYECGCKITSFKNFFSIEYCPLHKSAPDLYEACNRALTIIESNLGDTHPLAVERIRQALAKAEGKRGVFIKEVEPPKDFDEKEIEKILAEAEDE